MAIFDFIPPDVQQLLTKAGNEYRPVDSEQLQRLIDRADRLVASESIVKNADVLFESSFRADLDELKRAVEVVPPAGKNLRCFCSGTYCIELFAGDERVAQIVNHHWRSVRCSEWDSDAWLADVNLWAEWFARRRMEGPAWYYEPPQEPDQLQLEEEAANYSRWMAAMPGCVVSIWESSLDPMGLVDLESLSTELTASIPDPVERILALLHWYGSGTGRWSSNPMYEKNVEFLLGWEDNEQIVAVGLSDRVSRTQLEGVARFYGADLYTPRNYPEPPIPDALKQRLWNYVMNTDDPDKLARATRAFR